MSAPSSCGGGGSRGESVIVMWRRRGGFLQNFL